jgi:hypothetical protein
VASLRPQNIRRGVLLLVTGQSNLLVYRRLCSFVILQTPSPNIRFDSFKHGTYGPVTATRTHGKHRTYGPVTATQTQGTTELTDQ